MYAAAPDPAMSLASVDIDESDMSVARDSIELAAVAALAILDGRSETLSLSWLEGNDVIELKVLSELSELKELKASLV